MLAMYARTLQLPSTSFFLFGPLGTGKSTWLKQMLPDAKRYDLLLNNTLLSLMRDPGLLSKQVGALPSGSWIVIGEVQKFPELLSEVHAILFEHGDDYRFALTGSSARKLKRLNVDLLAGRAITRSFFPLAGREVNFEFDVENWLKYGSLPAIMNKPAIAIDTLEAYVGTYLKEEIQQEALVENIGSFSRFLEVAGIMNGQVVNVSGISREAAVARPTVQRYFDVLSDTLVGYFLPAWKLKAKVKEAVHPKFYLFDPGVARTVAGRVREPIESQERGALLETVVLQELRSWINSSNCGGQLYYWGTTSGGEIDFIWQRGKRAVGIEVKASKTWRHDFGDSLKEFSAKKHLSDAYGVFLGDEALKDGVISVLPLKEFMRKLSQGEIFI